MRKIYYRLVYNRKKKLNARGTALVQVEAYLDKKKAYFSTGIYVLPSQWDAQKAKIVRHPNEEALNRFLQELLMTYEQKELLAWKQGKQIDLNLFKTSKPPKTESLVGIGRKWVENSNCKDSTRRNKQTTLNLLEAFRSSAQFADLSYEWLTEFEQFMRKRSLSTNTIAKHLKQLRSLVNEAIHFGILPADASPFRNFRIKTTATHYAVLMPEEMRKLEELQLAKANTCLQHTLDAFLFCCYTGLRYSDFTHQLPTNLHQSGGHIWLIFSSVKTSIESKIPLDLIFQGKALAIMNKYAGREKEFFSLPPNSLVNKRLNRLGRLAHINKHFSFHSARHTNATLLIYMGAQITTVQKLLGHRNVKTTQGYSDVLAETIVKDLQNCKF
ncbi:MAG: site-specific integrase [Phocaeicola plebeius]|nr:site-specific integrase [Phocaeicola plebeius]